MKFIFLVLVGLLFLTASASAITLRWSDVEGNLSEGARNLAGDGTTASGASGACNSTFFSGDNCGMYVYGIISLILLNLILFRLGQGSSLFILANLLWLYILDQYQLFPHGVVVSIEILGGLVIAYAFWRAVQPR